MTQNQFNSAPVSPSRADPDPKTPKLHRSEWFNNWASGVAALLSVVIAVLSFSLNAKVNNFDRDLKNLEANRELSEFIGGSIQHLISTDKGLQKDLAVLAVTSPLTNNDITDHHNLLLGYRLTRRLIQTPTQDTKKLEQGQLEDLTNNTDTQDSNFEQNISQNFALLDIALEKNMETAYELDDVISNYEQSEQDEINNRRCDIATEINAQDKDFKCSPEFSYKEEARRLLPENKDILLSSTISPNENLQNKTKYQIKANNLAREGLAKILDSSKKEALVNIYSDSDLAITEMIDSAFSQDDKWLVPNQVVQTEIPENINSAVLYYREEDRGLANSLVDHLNKTWDDDTRRSIGSLAVLDASEKLKQQAEQQGTDISIPARNLELWITTEGHSAIETE